MADKEDGCLIDIIIIFLALVLLAIICSKSGSTNAATPLLLVYWGRLTTAPTRS